MVVIECFVFDCIFVIEDVFEVLVIVFIINYNIVYRVSAFIVFLVFIVISGSKLERSKVNIGVTLEEWNVFTRRWEVFKLGLGISNVSAFF